MKSMSLKFPDVLFTLHGDGEEQGDEWRKYFLNSKMQLYRAQVTFAPFNPKELK